MIIGLLPYSSPSPFIYLLISYLPFFPTQAFLNTVAPISLGQSLIKRATIVDEKLSQPKEKNLQKMQRNHPCNNEAFMKVLKKPSHGLKWKSLFFKMVVHSLASLCRLLSHLNGQHKAKIRK